MKIFNPSTSFFVLFLTRHTGSGLISSSSLHRHKLIPHLLLTRRSILAAMTTTAASLALPSDQSLQQSITLLDSIYGPVNSSDFPLPMSPNEAGPCSTMWTGTDQRQLPQRRYLWTDAFAVLAYQTISTIYSKQGNVERSNLYMAAVDKLISTVNQCLGRPRSEREEDAMTKCDVSPTGYVGLRIGKVESRIDTDYGMRYDGQYFHYIDKWLFALSRTNHVEDGLRVSKSIFPYFFEQSSRGGGGIRWKLSVNAHPPSSLPPTFGANDDTLNALIVFTLLESQRQRDNNCMPSLNLQKEIQTLQDSLRNYRPRVTDDPLGWGLEAIYDQFLDQHPRTKQLRALAREALNPSHISLPFRLYGALIGATVSNEHLVSDSDLEKLKSFCVKYQFREMEKSAKGKYAEDFAEINRVMLAVALLGPGTLHRIDDDPMVQL